MLGAGASPWEGHSPQPLPLMAVIESVHRFSITWILAKGPALTPGSQERVLEERTRPSMGATGPWRGGISGDQRRATRGSGPWVSRGGGT